MLGLPDTLASGIPVAGDWNVLGYGAFGVILSVVAVGNNQIINRSCRLVNRTGNSVQQRGWAKEPA
jgi:hypothetical protein